MGAQGAKKKKSRVVRKKRVHSLALGVGVAVVDKPIYVDQALVGHARGRNLSKSFLRKWVEENWGSQLSTLLVVNNLMKGWFSFLMASKDDVDRMVLGRWEMAGVPIVLRKWSPIFDAAKERVGKEPIWVKLPSLPIHLWNYFFFKMLGHHFGEFLDVDFSFRDIGEMAVAQVLVLLDLREGLAPEIVLTAKYGDYSQMLDYEGVPFRCHKCHSIDHTMADCDFPFQAYKRPDGRGERGRDEIDNLKKYKSSSPRSKSLSSGQEQKVKEPCHNTPLIVSFMPVEGSEVGRMDACMDEGGSAPIVLTGMNCI